MYTQCIRMYICYCVFNFYISVFDVIAEKDVQVTNEEQRIVWEEHGLRLHIPPNSLPDHCTEFQLKVAVAVSGHFTFPKEGVLVSGVYSFSHDLGDKELRHPATVEMQHCANLNTLNSLCIVRADEKSETPYEFRDIPGSTFTQSEGYGAIQLRRFCKLTTYLVWRSLSLIFTLGYCAKLYYTNIEFGGFDFHLYIIPNLEVIMRVSQCLHIIFLLVILKTFFRTLNQKLKTETMNMDH